MSDPTLDSLVRDTSFAGETTTSIADLRSDVSEIKGDVKHIRHTIDRWGGATAIIGVSIVYAPCPRRLVPRTACPCQGLPWLPCRR